MKASVAERRGRMSPLGAVGDKRRIVLGGRPAYENAQT